MTMTDFLISLDRRLLTGVVIILAALTFMSGTKPRSVVTHNSLPKFKMGQCVARKDREAWEAQVAAIVVQVGKKKYLYEGWDHYAKHKKKYPWAQRHNGLTANIGVFDDTYEAVPCPAVQSHPRAKYPRSPKR